MAASVGLITRAQISLDTDRDTLELRITATSVPIAVFIAPLLTSANRKTRIPVSAHRSVFYQPPQGQRAPHPGILRRYKRSLLITGRGKFQTVPQIQDLPAKQISRSVSRLTIVRQGQYWVFGAPLIVDRPQTLLARRSIKGLFLPRRGQFTALPLTPPPPASPGPLPPTIFRAITRYGIRVRRGRFILGVSPISITYPAPIATQGVSTPLAVATGGITTPLAVAT